MYNIEYLKLTMFIHIIDCLQPNQIATRLSNTLVFTKLELLLCGATAIIFWFRDLYKRVDHLS